MIEHRSPLERIGYFGSKQQGIFKKYLRIPMPYLSVVVKNYRDLAQVPVVLPGLIEKINQHLWSNMSQKTMLETKYKVYGVPVPYLQDSSVPVAAVKVTRLYESILTDIERFVGSPVTLYMYSGFETSAVRAASGIVKVALNKGLDARMVSFPKFMELVKQWDEGSAEVKTFETAKLLALYMVGSDYTTDFVAAAMKSLLNKRRADGLVTLLVSHLEPVEFNRRYQTELQAVPMKFEDDKITSTVDELLKYMNGGEIK